MSSSRYRLPPLGGGLGHMGWVGWLACAGSSPFGYSRTPADWRQVRVGTRVLRDRGGRRLQHVGQTSGGLSLRSVMDSRTTWNPFRRRTGTDSRPLTPERVLLLLQGRTPAELTLWGAYPRTDEEQPGHQHRLPEKSATGDGLRPRTNHGNPPWWDVDAFILLLIINMEPSPFGDDES